MGILNKTGHHNKVIAKKNLKRVRRFFKNSNKSIKECCEALKLSKPTVLKYADIIKKENEIGKKTRRNRTQ